MPDQYKWYSIYNLIPAAWLIIAIVWAFSTPVFSPFMMPISFLVTSFIFFFAKKFRKESVLACVIYDIGKMNIFMIPRNIDFWLNFAGIVFLLGALKSFQEAISTINQLHLP